MSRSWSTCLCIGAVAACLATACATTTIGDGGPTGALAPGPDYDVLFPRYLEVCAASPSRALFGEDRERPGDVKLYVKGACRDASSPFPLLETCGEDVDLSDPEAGVGVSVSALFENVRWIATPGKRLFYHGDLGSDETLEVDEALAAVEAAERARLFEGVEIRASRRSASENAGAVLAAETLGTDFALSFGRTLACARLPIGPRQLENAIGYLNDVNRDTALGNDTPESGSTGEIRHIVHNALSAAGVWRHRSPTVYGMGRVASLVTPSDEMADLALLSTELPIEDVDRVMADDHLRAALARFDWLPTRQGAMVYVIPVHSNNALYDTNVTLSQRWSPFGRRTADGLTEIFERARNLDVQANLLHFRDAYARILAARPAGGGAESERATADRARAHYYRYIEAQLADVDNKLRRLASRTPETPRPDLEVGLASPDPTAVEPLEGATRVLAAYEAAYEARDVDRLASVWLMSPEQVEATRYFFESTSPIAMTIVQREIRIENDIVTVDFDQRVAARNLRTSQVALRASLVPRGEDWMIVRIAPSPAEVARAPTATATATATTERETSPLAPGAVASAPPLMPPHEAVQWLLAEYEAAYETRDVERLAGVWQMSREQRNATRRFFGETDPIAMAIVERGVQVEDHAVAVDFDQHVRAKGMRDSSVALRATLESDGDTWQIRHISPR